MEAVFQRIQQANLRVKIQKCKFAASEASFLGHIITREGLKMEPKKIEAISKLAYPETKTQMRSSWDLRDTIALLLSILLA